MAFLQRSVEKLKKTNDVMMVCGWTALASQHPLENDHKNYEICQIRHKNCEWSARFFKFVYDSSKPSRSHFLAPFAEK